jgi:hypothetical protein
MWKDFDFGTTDNSFELSFDWKIRGRATGVYCGIILYLTELVEPPTNALPADSDAITLVYGSDEWENETIFLGNITGNKRLVILSFGYSNAEELIVPAAIDNLAINIVTCTPPTSAILVSSLTFGIGHIVNLFNGSGAELLPNILQVIYATSAGFVFVMLYHKSNSLIICILVHAIFNSLSAFGVEYDSVELQILTAGILTIITGGYAIYLSKIKISENDLIKNV